jgi:hypothetical protein
MNTAAADAAHKQAMKASPQEMAASLQDVAGQRLVAYVTKNKSPKVVGRWALAQHAPQGESLQLLRDLFRAYLILRDSEQPDTIRAWLQSANPHLNDQAPIEVLREGDSAAVFKAAADFLRD